jgi:hypothetical protein
MCLWSRRHYNDSNHARSIKQGCLAFFSIKWLYTWPKVVELCFYHWNTHLNKSKIGTWPSRSRIINSHVIICSSNFSSFERSHLDSIEFRPHSQANLWQAQSYMVKTCESRESYDKEWLHPTKGHCLFGSET